MAQKHTRQCMIFIAVWFGSYTIPRAVGYIKKDQVFF